MSVKKYGGITREVYFLKVDRNQSRPLPPLLYKRIAPWGRYGFQGGGALQFFFDINTKRGKLSQGGGYKAITHPFCIKELSPGTSTSSRGGGLSW